MKTVLALLCAWALSLSVHAAPQCMNNICLNPAGQSCAAGGTTIYQCPPNTNPGLMSGSNSTCVCTPLVTLNTAGTSCMVNNTINSALCMGNYDTCTTVSANTSVCTGNRAHGDVCAVAADCRSLQCSAGKCVGHTVQAFCTDSRDCAPGLWCSTTNHTCTPRLLVGQTCVATVDSCPLLSWCFKGVCTDGFSLPLGSSVAVVGANPIDRLCVSGVSDANGTCIAFPLATYLAVANRPCQSDADCSRVGVCACNGGYGTQAVCVPNSIYAFGFPDSRYDITVMTNKSAAVRTQCAAVEFATAFNHATCIMVTDPYWASVGCHEARELWIWNYYVGYCAFETSMLTTINTVCQATIGALAQLPDGRLSINGTVSPNLLPATSAPTSLATTIANTAAPSTARVTAAPSTTTTTAGVTTAPSTPVGTIAKTSAPTAGITPASHGTNTTKSAAMSLKQIGNAAWLLLAGVAVLATGW